MSRVLVIFPGALGDLVCLAPSLWAIRRSYPDASLELMAREELVRLATGRLGIDRGLSIDRREVSAMFIAGSAENQLFAGYERIFSFFAADNPMFRANLIAAAGDGEVSFHPFRPPGTEHVAIANLKSIGLDGAPLDSRIHLLNDDMEAADEQIAALGLGPNQFIVIFPGSGSPAKNWPLGSFVALAGRLARTIVALFIAGPAETEFEARLQANGVPMLSGLELPVVAALASRARLFVGNDSGVSHLAAATGAPGIVIFGPTDPARFRPLGPVKVIRRLPLDALRDDEVTTVVEAELAIPR